MATSGSDAVVPVTYAASVDATCRAVRQFARQVGRALNGPIAPRRRRPKRVAKKIRRRAGLLRHGTLTDLLALAAKHGG